MLNKFKKIKLEHILELLIIGTAFIPGMILRLIKRDIWIVSENGDDAKDNGYTFFKYVMDKEKKQDVYYVVKRDSIYYEKLKEYSKNILYQNSLKHNIYTIAATKYISSQIGSGLPFPQIVFNLQKTFIYRFKSIFLQHGITQNRVQCLLPNESKVDMFCCAAKDEYNFVTKELCYNEEQVKKTGFCRFDWLKDESEKYNKILMMFTWRKQFENNEEEFVKSDYYLTIQGLLNNERLINFLENQKLELCVCLHDNMMQYKDKFMPSSNRITIVDKTQKSIQELLRECKYLITDYSSIAFDFAYMKKPLQYFQFDYEEFREKHLKEGYWKYDDGFGKVTTTVEECVNELIKSHENNFAVEQKYIEKSKDFYIFSDDKSSQRTYEEIENMKNDGIDTDSWWALIAICFAIGFFTSQLFILLLCSIAGIILNILYTKKELKEKIYFILFNIVTFIFLLSKPAVSVFNGINWANKFPVETQKNAFLLIFISILSLYIGTRLAKTNKDEENIKQVKTKKIFKSIVLVLFVICAIFSTIIEYDKLIYMSGKDYVDYYLTYENMFNPIITLMAGMANVFFCIYLACMPEKKKVILPIGIFFSYNLPTFIIGQRTPLVVSILFVLSYFIIRDYLDNTKPWIGKYEKALMLFAIPCAIIGLAIFNYSRVDEDLPTRNIVGLFCDFFYNQGVSYDVINIGYMKKNEIKNLTNHNYTFGPFIDYFKYSTITQALFNVEDLPAGNNAKRALESSSYSHILSYLSREDYLEGHGWGSCFILETYTDFGYIGVIIYSVLLGYLLTVIPILLKKNTFVSSIVLIATLNIFIIPRAEALQFLQFIITPQFWGAWLICIVIYNITGRIIDKRETRRGK